MGHYSIGRLLLPRRAVLGGAVLTAASAAFAWRGSIEDSDIHVTPEQFGAVGDGVADDGVAFRRACQHCAATGQHLRLSRRRYRNSRLEVHGSFDVIGEGAVIDYLGIGNTLIGGLGHGRTALPRAWPAVDRDAYADLFPVQMVALARPAARGTTTLALTHASGLQAGDRLFLAQVPTTMSSPINYIPSAFAFVQVRSVTGRQATLAEPLPEDFDAGAGGFATPGIAVGCRISDLTIATDKDAYQHVVRSGIDITLERIDFAGKSTVGACTFADRVTYRDCNVRNAYGSLSFARGCGSITVDGLTFSTQRDPPTSEPFALFLEESFRDVMLRNVQGDGAGFSIRMVDMASVARRSRVVLERCRIRTDNAARGATSPFQCGTSIGLDIEVRDSVLRGASLMPDPNQFPGIGKRALTWMSANGGDDQLTFAGCRFESTNGGTAFAAGAGFQGRLSIDPASNRFVGCQPPS